MDSDRKKQIDSAQRSGFRRIEKMHPIRMLLYISMMGIGVLFFILTVAFARTGGFPGEQFELPKFFSVSAILLLFSSFTISKVPSMYRKEKLKKMSRYLALTLSLGILFIVAQLIGWNEMSRAGVYFSGKASGTYLYLISALHILHLLGGIIFLSFMLFKTIYVASDGVRSLIFIRDPFRNMQLSMLNSYWHFMDFLWLGLYLVFLFIA
ncbi:cytochrome c oxidase subunit 3 [Pontibacter ummariensis]|uniref:Cytochrome c oxidase subunit 3 n=1 Tax=Pontibacter ummariensis TaxID=1610492 RepID=A0A239FAJ0_9BACT|nr:cytochrome c oxidase subunit 3 [Pontibacter ummariensis]PRY12369.1 cytochrome c oxidase subunit 3 [Pontibacter ummariensis]SNS53313.1 cytochrome c oxidase subunit 3 [Pontibacter ummariensis]